MQKARNKIYAAVVAVVLLVAAALSLLIPWRMKSASAQQISEKSGIFYATFTPKLAESSQSPNYYRTLRVTVDTYNTAMCIERSYGASASPQAILISESKPVEIFFEKYNSENKTWAFSGYLEVTGNNSVSGYYGSMSGNPNAGDVPQVLAVVRSTDSTINSYTIDIGGNYFDGQGIYRMTMSAYFDFHCSPLGGSNFDVMCTYSTIIDASGRSYVFGPYQTVEKTDLSNEELYKSGYNAGFSEGLAQINESEAYQRGYDKGLHDGKLEGTGTPAAPASVEEAYKKGYSEGYFAGLEVNNKDSKWYDGYKKGYNDAVNGFTKAEDPEVPEEPAKAWYQTAWEYFVNWIKVYWWVVVIAVAALSIGIALAVRRRRW